MVAKITRCCAYLLCLWGCGWTTVRWRQKVYFPADLQFFLQNWGMHTVAAFGLTIIVFLLAMIILTMYVSGNRSSRDFVKVIVLGSLAMMVVAELLQCFVSGRWFKTHELIALIIGGLLIGAVIFASKKWFPPGFIGDLSVNDRASKYFLRVIIINYIVTTIVTSLDESLQCFRPGRVVDKYDFIAQIIGGFVAATAIYFIGPILPKIEQEESEAASD